MYNKKFELFDVHKAAQFLDVSLKSIRRWAQKGKLRGIKVGLRGDWRFARKDLMKFINKNF